MDWVQTRGLGPEWERETNQQVQAEAQCAEKV